MKPGRRGFLGRLGSAALLAPVALVTATGPAQGEARPGALVLGDGARLENVDLPPEVPVLIRGDRVLFRGNTVQGRMVVEGEYAVVADNLFVSPHRGESA